MKILQVLPSLGSGGAEHFTIGLVNELIRQGHECDVLTLFDIKAGDDLLNNISPKANHSTLHKKPGFDIGCYFKLYKYIKKGGYDVVHTHVGAIPYILLSTLLLRKVKFVATIHSEARREAGRNIMKWSRFYMFQHHKCTPVTISEESKTSFDEYYKMDAAMVYNGVDKYTGVGFSSLRDNDEQLLFIHPASCQVVKNQELLIKAFAKLTNDYPNIKMLWLGSNSTYKSLYETLETFMVPQFKYVGTVPNVRDYLIQADAMCLSSKMEGMPMTIIEAFSVGCPALCTPVGGILNMVENGQNGMLSSSLEVDDYYDMLKRFCELGDEEKEKMHIKAKESFAKYSIENSAKGYIEVYKSKNK